VAPTSSAIWVNRLKPSTLLRIASIVSFVYFLGHTIGIPWTPPANCTGGRPLAVSWWIGKYERFGT
jgi:hypothetical protein